MNSFRTIRAALCALSLMLLAACGDRSAGEPSRTAGIAADATAPAAPAPAPQGEQLAARKRGVSDTAEAAPRRHVAVSHELQLVTDAEGVEAAWRSASDACAAAGCELLSSQLLRDDERQPAQALLEARLPPQQVDAFLQRITSLGRIGRHTRQAEGWTKQKAVSLSITA